MKLQPVQILIICLVFAGALKAEVLWHASYDADLKGSSGTVYSGSNVTIVNGQVQVGLPQGTSTGVFLRYDDIDFLIPANGSIRVKFNVANPDAMSQSALLTTYLRSNPFDNYMWFGLGANGTMVLVRSHSSSGTPTGEQTYSATIQKITAGMHEMVLTWEQMLPFATGTREQANIKLYLDGTVVLSRDNTAWTRWGNTYFEIGCFYNMQSQTTYFACGLGGITIDNVEIEQTALADFVCGDKGTVYLMSDLNHDCYVGIADLAQIAAEWLRCTDPADRNCDEYWDF